MVSPRRRSLVTFLVLFAALVLARGFFTHQRSRNALLPVRSVFATDWRPVWHEATATAGVGGTLQVTNLETTFSPGGQIGTTVVDLALFGRDGSRRTVAVTTLGNGVFSFSAQDAPPTAVTGVPAELVSDLFAGRALARWCRAHPAPRYALDLLAAPAGSPTVALRDGRFAPAARGPVVSALAVTPLFGKNGAQSGKTELWIRP